MQPNMRQCDIASTELTSMKICRGLGCTSTELIKAHIIPQSFGRYVEGNSGPNVMLSSEGRSMKTPRGLFDTGILCANVTDISTKSTTTRFPLLQILRSS